MEVKVSVIIPMYNVASLVQRCIHSLCSQTYRNLELIFVNDCSKDDTIEKVNELMARETLDGISWKIVSHDVNRGVAAARNTGLDSATGDYVYYVDSDDYIEENAVERMVSIAEAGGCDMVSCEWLLEFGRNSRYMVQPDVSTGEEIFKKMCYGKARWNLWLFLVKRSLYEDNYLRFAPGVNMGEDMMVMLKMSLCARHVAVIHEPLYHYIQTNAAAISKDIRPYIPQIKANVADVESFVTTLFGERYVNELAQLKLSLKLPLLISSEKSSYEQWLAWWPETNSKLNGNPELSWRTNLIQNCAVKRLFVLNRLYYWCIIKVVYGIIFR